MGVNGTTIPTIGCTAVAVILQYFYSVTFMWMLMEGVILYIKLVKVFGNEDRKHYIIFTTVSYGRYCYSASRLFIIYSDVYCVIRIELGAQCRLIIFSCLV